jgi:probable HAF family extracellular repeat protein
MKEETEQVMTHQPAISFSNSIHFPFNRAGGRTSNVRKKNKMQTYHKLLALIVTGLVVPDHSRAAVFRGLGDLPGGSFDGGVYSIADDVSGDGRVVVGSTSSAAAGSLLEGYRWDATNGMTGIGDLAGGDFNGNAVAVSGDGTVIAGSGHSSSGFQATRWTSETGTVGLGDLSGGAFNSYALGVSGDGTAIVGSSNSALGLEAFAWTVGSGMVGLGDLAGGSFRSEATGASHDGSVIVGYSNTATGDQAFHWTATSGMIGLGHFAGGGFTIGTGVSADGQTIIGWGSSAAGPAAFRWTAGTGIVSLGDLSGGSFNSYAAATSADGSVIVGFGSSATGSEAMIWTEGDGMISLQSYMINDLGVAGLDGWQLKEARGVSADGRTIVGVGVNPLGQTEGWIAVIPEPSIALFLLPTMFFLTKRMRYHPPINR